MRNIEKTGNPAFGLQVIVLKRSLHPAAKTQEKCEDGKAFVIRPSGRPAC